MLSVSTARATAVNAGVARSDRTAWRTSRHSGVERRGPHVADGFARLRHAAEMRRRDAARFGRRQAARDVGVNLLLKVERQLVVGFGIDPAASERCRGRRAINRVSMVILASNSATRPRAHGASTARSAPSSFARPRAGGGRQA